jgi:hypothetical protein
MVGYILYWDTPQELIHNEAELGRAKCQQCHPMDLSHRSVGLIMQFRI